MALDDKETTKKIIEFSLNGKNVSASEDETIWQVAKRMDLEIPHLCWKDSPGYRADGNCRACMVEIEGERTLAASCLRKPTHGMKVNTSNTRVEKNRKLVFELLKSDMPKREESPDPDSHFWDQTRKVLGEETPRFPSARPGASKEIPVDSIFHDASHPSIAVNLDACISCGLC